MENFECSINSLRNFCKISNIIFHQRIADETGLPHERLFHVQTIVSNPSKKLNIGTFDGFGHSIKAAKRNSAFAALEDLKYTISSIGYGGKNEEENFSSVLKLNEEDLLTSNDAYSDLVKLGMQFKVPVCMLKSGPDYCVSFCHCTFSSPIGYVEASYKAIRAIRTQIESLNNISIQSYAWRLEVISRLRSLSLSFEVSEMLNKFSVNCILPPFMKTTASAKTLERAKELASRLMFSQLKKSEKSPLTVSSIGQKSIESPRKVKDHIRGSCDYSGSLNPVERLELIQQANKQPEPVYNFEELCPPVKVTLSCDGDKIVKSRRGPIKFRFTCHLGEIAIRGDACCNKRLAKRSAAEKALKTMGVDAYQQLKIQNNTVSHPRLLNTLRSGSQLKAPKGSAVSFSCAKEVFIFGSVNQPDIKFVSKSNRRSRSACRPERHLSMNRDIPRSASVGMDTFTYGLNLLCTAPRDNSFFTNPEEINQEVKIEEKPLPNPLQDAVSWQLLASLGRVLMCRGSRSDLSLSAPKSAGLDAQLLQMCSHFGIPCQLTELSGLNDEGKVWVPVQNRKFHKYAESGCSFLLQIGRNHSVSRFLPSSEDLRDKSARPKGPQTKCLKCGHTGRGGCFLSTGTSRAGCRQDLALHVLKCLISPAQ